MSEPLRQSVIDVVGKSGGVANATLVTWGAVWANIFEAVQPLIGILVSIALLAITYGLSLKRNRLIAKEIAIRDKDLELRNKDLELRDAQIRAINDRHECREENK